MTKICWICQKNLADSGEHSVKHSDLRNAFTKGKKLFLHTRTLINKKVSGTNSKELKPVKICSDCNNRMLQPYDMAWQAFADAHANNGSPDTDILLLPPEEKLKIQLFFVAKLGCFLKEANVAIDLSSFSCALLNKTAHPNIYIKILSSRPSEIGRSDLEKIEYAGQIVCLVIQYNVMGISAQIIYALPSEANREGVVTASIKPSDLKGVKL
ncbi:MAG: hypothetical protein COY40_03065 [Alphaproteobacteria bacterium CG_4_10_14_0_8_um_filter_53_9]|nr:MAG: hypothetical protein COY40_03065 [Alphaproteobacteria bacterium CG_4_10_14_0_8_um_filter_53_9]